MATAISTPPIERDDIHAATISRQLDHLIYASLILSTSIFVCSMVMLGFSSLFVGITGFGLILIHHPIILCHRWKLRKLKNAEQHHKATISTSKLPIPISSRKFTIFAAWFISLVYTAAFGIVITMAQFMFRGYYEYWHPRVASAVVEAVLLFFEVPLLVTIALWCIRERKAVLGMEPKWYHLPQYSARKCE